MPELPLPVVLPVPERSVPLTNEGVQQLLTHGRENPSAVTSVVAQLRSNPRATITALFSLSATQQAALEQMSDAELTARLAPSIQALQAGQLTGWAFEPPNMEPEPEAIKGGGSCNCWGNVSTA
jgi:hypothetical protein